MTQTEDRLSQSIAYLEANLALCRARPHRHGHQMAAYERYLAMARASSSGEEFTARVKADGDMFEINRALTLDRYENAAAIHRMLGDDRALGAALLCMQAAREASGHLDLSSRMTAALAESEPLRQAALVTTDQIRGLFIALLDWAMQANPGLRTSHLAVLRQAWETLRTHDPDCTYEKLCHYPPYRRRIPFSDAGLLRLGAWFQEALGQWTPR